MQNLVPPNTTPGFQTFSLAHQPLLDWRSGTFPFTFSAWREDRLDLASQATHFGFVFEDACTLRTNNGDFPLHPKMYFSLPGEGYIEGGRGIVISRWDCHGFFHLGGPIESRGRLQYIDGCSDSLLIPPTLKGEPCLNLLHIPAGVDQTPHTHPSERVGLVVSGGGVCRADHQETALTPGMAWVIHANHLHSFHTQDSDLTIIAFHPDSDFGPSDQNHPMLNRTLINGVSASRSLGGSSP